MVDQSDIRAMKYARSEFIRRGFDISRANIQSRYGVMHVTGVIPYPAAMCAEAFKHEIDVIKHVLRAKCDLKEVVLDTHTV